MTVSLERGIGSKKKMQKNMLNDGGNNYYILSNIFGTDSAFQVCETLVEMGSLETVTNDWSPFSHSL